MAEVPLADQGGLVAGVAWSIVGNVGWRASQVRVQRRDAVHVVYVPVRIVARDGEQIEFVQKQASKRMPSAARRSMPGVALTRLP